MENKNKCGERDIFGKVRDICESPPRYKEIRISIDPNPVSVRAWLGEIAYEGTVILIRFIKF